LGERLAPERLVDLAALAPGPAHQSSSARSGSDLLESASSTPFDTKRGAQCAIAMATRGVGDFVFVPLRH